MSKIPVNVRKAFVIVVLLVIAMIYMIVATGVEFYIWQRFTSRDVDKLLVWNVLLSPYVYGPVAVKTYENIRRTLRCKDASQVRRA